MRPVLVQPGDKWSNWTILAEIRGKDFGTGKIRLFKCRCVCGAVRTMRLSNLRFKQSKNCRKCRPGNRLTHGLYGTPEYRAWRGMRNRCLNPNEPAWKDYGGRGIKVAKRWNDFTNFLSDVGQRPGPGYTLDRFPDNDGDYKPGNVRWATHKQQANNRRNTIRLEFEGQIRSVGEWADLLQINLVTLWVRLYKYNWSIERALTEPVQYKKKYQRRSQ